MCDKGARYNARAAATLSVRCKLQARRINEFTFPSSVFTLGANALPPVILSLVDPDRRIRSLLTIAPDTGAPQ